MMLRTFILVIITLQKEHLRSFIGVCVSCEINESVARRLLPSLFSDERRGDPLLLLFYHYHNFVNLFADDFVSPFNDSIKLLLGDEPVHEHLLGSFEFVGV